MPSLADAVRPWHDLYIVIGTASATLIGLLIGATGLYGQGYAAIVWRGMLRQGVPVPIDLEDRVCYAAIPAIGYTAMLAAGAMFLLGHEAGCALLAMAMGSLLLIGIRNAWDMTLFTVMRQRD
jgi:hypothetical protein